MNRSGSSTGVGSSSGSADDAGVGAGSRGVFTDADASADDVGSPTNGKGSYSGRSQSAAASSIGNHVGVWCLRANCRMMSEPTTNLVQERLWVH